MTTTDKDAATFDPTKPVQLRNGRPKEANMASDVEKARDQLRWSLENAVPMATSVLVDIEDFIDAKIAEERERSFKIKPEGGDAPYNSVSNPPPESCACSPAVGESATSSGDGAGPVAWQIKDFADGWITYSCRDEQLARRVAEDADAALRPLYPFSALRAAHVAGMREAAEIARGLPITVPKQDASSWNKPFDQHVTTAADAADAIRAAADAKEKEGGRD